MRWAILSPPPPSSSLSTPGSNIVFQLRWPPLGGQDELATLEEEEEKRQTEEGKIAA